MHETKIRTRKNDRPRNSTFTVKLTDYFKTVKDIEYSKDQLLEILTSVPFSKISIPVYTFKSLVFANDSKGTMVVGFIKSFDIEKEVFEVVIYGNYVECVSKFENVVINPRVFINEETGDVKNIIALDIVPVE